MAKNIFKFITRGVVDLTDKMVGTSANFAFEITEAFVDGVSTSFTWDDGVLDIPSYTSGTVKCHFSLYLIHGDTSQYGSKDPEDTGTDVVFWEERISRQPVVASSIKNFEQGKISFKISNVVFTALGGDWEQLLDNVDFVGPTITAYKNDILLYNGTGNGSQVNNGSITVIVKNQATTLDEECNWNDPSYLNRIESSHNSSYYNGSAIPEKYYGVAIPFVIGDRMAYQDFEGQNVDSGEDITGSPPLIQPGSSVTSRSVGTGFICRVIPTSPTGGIICRLPNFQNLSSNVTTDTSASDPLQPKIWSKIKDGTNSSLNILPSQLVRMNTTGANLAGRCLFTGPTVYQLNSGVSSSVNFVNAEYDSELHLCGTNPPTSAFDPSAVSISYDNTPGGHRLMKISASGVDFTKYDYYLVCSNVTGSISAPKALQFILESHDLPVDTASFDAMDSAYPQKTCIQVGSNKRIKTINDVIGEINRSLLTYTKIPLTGESISMNDIDLDPSPSDTLTDEEIRELRIQVTGEQIYSTIEFEPLYAKGSIYRDDVYDSRTNNEADSVYKSDRTKTISHVLTSKPSRWSEIADYYGRPSPEVSFLLLEDNDYDVGDYVTIDHSDFKGDIIITSIGPKQIGSSITGKKI